MTHFTAKFSFHINLKDDQNHENILFGPLCTISFVTAETK